MAKLILSLDGAVIREIQLAKDRTTIGRKAQNDIAIDNLAVSGEHAQIVTILNDSFLEDLGSTNGTLVNGNSIKKHFLQNNDVIEIGKYKMKYINEGGVAQVAPADFEKTMVLRPGARITEEAPKNLGSDTLVNTPAYTPPAQAAAPTAAHDAVSPESPPLSAKELGAGSVAQPAPVAPPQVSPPHVVPQPQAPHPAAGHPGLAALQVLTGPNAGKELEIAKTLITIGKPGVQVAVIARRPQGYFITHVEGANYPILNGKVLDAQAHRLSDHDVIELAGVKMEFFLKTD